MPLYNSSSFTNLSYTGTLTGGTDVIAIGTNQIYKDASGNVGIGAVPSGTYKLEVSGNITSTKILVGTGANFTRFPNSLLVSSNTASGIQQNEPHNSGIIGEGTGSVVTTTITGTSGANTITVGSNTGLYVGMIVTGTGIGTGTVLITIIAGTTITLSVNNSGTVSGTGTFVLIGSGVYGKGYTSGAARSGGVIGEAHVSATGDVGSAIGVRGYANDTHAGGLNIGLYGDATGGSSNYALYMNRGDISSGVAQTWSLGGNLTFSGAYTVIIPTLNLTNVLGTSYGGTGVNNGSNTLTLAGNVSHAGAFAQTFTATATTTLTLPTTGTLSTLAGTETLTNKRINPRVYADTSNSATPTLNTDNYDMWVITGQSVAITSFTTNLTGTPVNGQKLWIAITGTTAIAITWGAMFEASTTSLPTTTVTTARLDVGFIYSSATSVWRCMAVA